jgi:hypothetical protein
VSVSQTATLEGDGERQQALPTKLVRLCNRVHATPKQFRYAMRGPAVGFSLRAAMNGKAECRSVFLL